MQMTSTLVTGAERGFRLMGDAAAPRGRGVLIRASQAALGDIKGPGASDPAIVVDGTSFAAIVASDVQEEPGAALTMRSASARLPHNVLMQNGMPERVRRSFVIDGGANLIFTGNVFHDVNRDRNDERRGGARPVAGRDKQLVDAARSTLSAAPRIRRGRR